MQSIASGSTKLLRPRLTRFSPCTAASQRRAADATPGERPVPLGTRKLQRVAASGKSYELYRVARAARGGGDSRDPLGRSCSAGRHPACFRGHSVKPSGPYPLGKNQSLSSPPLEPRRLLLSAMRQKVSKDRSQEGCAPLANPRRNCPNLAKPSCGPTPAVLCKTSSSLRVPSGTDRAGDAEHRNGLAKFSVRSLTAFFLPQPPRRDGRPTPPLAEGRCRSTREDWSSFCKVPQATDQNLRFATTAIEDRAPLRRPPRRAQLRCCSAGYGAGS